MKKVIPLLIGFILIYACSKGDELNGVPLGPTELVGSGISQTQITISWKDNSTNESGFKIERRATTGNYEVVGTSDADVLNFTDSNLNANTTYVYRVYSFNTRGKSLTYSNELYTQTLDVVVTINLAVTTTPISSILATQATSGGTITTNDYNSITQQGIVWNTAPNPTLDLLTKTYTNGSAFTSLITSLTASTTYYIRAYATNHIGNVYGQEYSFTTLPLSVPILVTHAAYDIYSNVATTGGFIAVDGGGVPVTARGVVWSTTQNPTIALNTKTIDGTGLGSFVSDLRGLTGGTLYYIRAYATNSIGTSYGDQRSFMTLPNPDPVIDIDGNSYPTVRIGTQIWTTANLNVSKYRNGDNIPQFCGSQDCTTNPINSSCWGSLTTGAWCYQYSESMSTYGKLYNWYTISDPRGIAPAGYHIPSKEEWLTLRNYLGGYSEAGGKMKSTTNWPSPNTGATNASGFSGLPGGGFGRVGVLVGFYYNYSYRPYGKGITGTWWSSKLTTSVYSPNNIVSQATHFSLNNTDSTLTDGGADRSNGFSIRLIKD